ncbi:MAG: YdcF family protein [Acidobacteria bacterium]|nr:YdcF family protein [Acidobacteriota bacterium]
MFTLKQFLKGLILPPMPWLLLLLVALLFWNRRWSRKLLLGTLLLATFLHSGLALHTVRHPLESRYAPLIDPRTEEPYDAIVVLTGGLVPAGGLIPFPQISESMFRRLDEGWRLYRLAPRPMIVSGGHVDPFSPPKNENQIACDYLIRWGVPAQDVIGEPRSRDTFESAVEVRKLLEQRGWRRYLLVTSAVHMPRSMLVFRSLCPDPIPAPGDFTIGESTWSPLRLFPSEEAGGFMTSTLHEYIGLVNYRLRIWTHSR